MSDYYDRKGNAISMREWSTSLREKKQRVASTVVGGYWVSTVWLGLDHSFGSGPPLIFETMVFPCDEKGNVTDWGDVDSERYSTEDEALSGHAAMVDKWSKKSE